VDRHGEESREGESREAPHRDFVREIALTT
jgi:hypothetical protein